MNSSSKRILLTGMLGTDADRYTGALAEFGFQVGLDLDTHEAVARLESERFEAVISGYPLEPGEIGRLLFTLRSHRSASNNAVFLLLAPSGRLRAAASLVGRGVTKALSTQENPSVIGIILKRMIEFAQPVSQRLPVRYEVVATVAGKEVLWLTENLSAGGMLIATDKPPPLGTTFSFDLALPSCEISGNGRVVRHVLAEREPVDGFGTRFLSFVGSGQIRLLDWLRSALESDSS